MKFKNEGLEAKLVGFEELNPTKSERPAREAY